MTKEQDTITAKFDRNVFQQFLSALPQIIAMILAMLKGKSLHQNALAIKPFPETYREHALEQAILILSKEMSMPAKDIKANREMVIALQSIIDAFGIAK